MNLTNYYIHTLGDLLSPVGVYQRIRDRFPHSFLLESSDYRGVENSCSIIGINPIAEITINEGIVSSSIRGEVIKQYELRERDEFLTALENFYSSFEVESEELFSFVRECSPNQVLKPLNGLLGYLAYEAIEYFEEIKLQAQVDEERKIPSAKYVLFEHLVQINHFKSEMFIQQNVLGEKPQESSDILNNILAIKDLITSKNVFESDFTVEGEEVSNFSDQEYLEVVNKAKQYIQRGDIFQMVPSRRYTQEYKGDDFQVYRALRAINPSPYLFYYDCGDFRLFGSSPEALIVAKDGKASSFPIAGTYFRKGTEEDDVEGSKQLLADEKENAEHVMLVDLARNDLSRLCTNVHVEKFKEVQFYSHVIHLVSKIVGDLDANISPFKLLKATFPHGTLSGAPKFRAMELIDSLEKGHRSHYAGAVGFITFDGNLNHAIMIRSFLSKNNKLHYQAGGGVVADSVPESEVSEVKNKLMALKKSIKIASSLQAGRD